MLETVSTAHNDLAFIESVDPYIYFLQHFGFASLVCSSVQTEACSGFCILNRLNVI